MRTVPTIRFPDLLNTFDGIIREALIRILGTPLDSTQWLQAKLPVTVGGLGIRGAEDHAGVAYTSSFTSSKPLMRQLLRVDEEIELSLSQDIVNNISIYLGMEPSLEMIDSHSQKEFSNMVDNHNLEKLKTKLEEEGNTREIARLASLGLPHAGAWLDAVPIPALGLYLHPSEFVLAVRYRIGSPVYD